jgi:hypothetical protein
MRNTATTSPGTIIAADHEAIAARASSTEYTCARSSLATRARSARSVPSVIRSERFAVRNERSTATPRIASSRLVLP